MLGFAKRSNIRLFLQLLVVASTLSSCRSSITQSGRNLRDCYKIILSNLLRRLAHCHFGLRANVIVPFTMEAVVSYSSR